MIGILRSVNWTPGEWICPKCGTKIMIPAGGTAKSYRTLAEEAAVTSPTMLRTLTHLGRSRFIVRTQSTRCHSVYVVKNWEVFQGGEAKGKQRRTTSEPQVKHIIEGKKNRREEKEDSRKSGKPASLPSEEGLKAAGQLLRSIIAWKPDHKLSLLADAQRADWARKQAPHFDRMHRLDKVSWERVTAVLEWLPTDGFWPANIQNGLKFRAQFDRIEAALRNPRGRHRGQQRELLPDNIRPLGGGK